jgi:HAD superfamily hydrolase (TIGR01509 family)
VTIAILDIDGTLVDTNYQHALAWYRAFRQHDIVLPVWRIHRHIGMGGDKLVAALAGQEVEDRAGDAIRDLENELFQEMIDEIVALPGARDFLARMQAAGVRTVLSSSAKPHEVDHYLDLLDARDLVLGWTTAGDVDATKPDPDLVAVALEKAGGTPAVMVGDSVWDCDAASRAGIPTIGIESGGINASELVGAGALCVISAVAHVTVEDVESMAGGRAPRPA